MDRQFVSEYVQKTYYLLRILQIVYKNMHIFKYIIVHVCHFVYLLDSIQAFNIKELFN